MIGEGLVLGARILGEFGDDPHRYADGKARRNYAGMVRRAHIVAPTAGTGLKPH
jgi:hypothetical protein